MWNPKRRRLLKAAAGVVAAGATVSCGGAKSPWRVLSIEEGETAAAICDLLIPADEFPGAAWAGAVDYIDRQLSGHFRRHRASYHKGLAALNAESRKRFGKSFTEIPADQRVEMLKDADKAKDPFFALILLHTMQSYYGDPRHGGNRDCMGYLSLGVPSTPVRGRSQHDLNQTGKQGAA